MADFRDHAGRQRIKLLDHWIVFSQRFMRMNNKWPCFISAFGRQKLSVPVIGQGTAGI
jgi:hypothetical protein